MTKQELIDHLQHLEKYTHYSEDAPALREVIEMLTETHACDLIDRREAIDALKQQAKEMFHWPERYAMQRQGVLKAINIVSDLPSAQQEPEHTMEEFMYGQDLGSPEDGSL